MSSSVHVDNKGKDILILGSSPTQRLDEHSLTPEKYIQLILLIIEKTVVWACIIMEKIAIYLLIIQKLLN